jgi:hypothetical protein
MGEKTLPIPSLLLDLVERGIWPADEAQAREFESAYQERPATTDKQPEILKPLGPPRVSVERIQRIDRSEDALHLEPPPFLSSRQRTSIAWAVSERPQYERYFAPDEIDRDLMIEIGDFGHGSDKPIILDYRNDLKEPSVYRLAFSRVISPTDGTKSWDNHWVKIAPSFDDFARLLGFI